MDKHTKVPKKPGPNENETRTKRNLTARRHQPNRFSFTKIHLTSIGQSAATMLSTMGKDNCIKCTLSTLSKFVHILHIYPAHFIR